MIFITLGSQKFQFNRLLREIDKLIEDGYIKENVFAQIGYSDYKPINYAYKEFLDRHEFKCMIDKCEKIITHGGTGAIITAIKSGKYVIAIPRLKEYGEHVDNHQLQIVNQFKEMQFIDAIYRIEELKECIKNIDKLEIKKYISNTSNIIESIELFLNNK